MLLGACGEKKANEVVLDQGSTPVIEAAVSEETEAPEEPESETEPMIEETETESEKTEIQIEPVEEEEPEPVEDEEKIIQKAVEDKLSEMSAEEKVWQLFIVTPEQLTGTDTVVRAGDTTRQALEDHMVGGIIYMGPNLIDRKQVKTMLGATQGFALKENDLPLFLAVDEEGGRVQRIGGKEGFDSPYISPMQEVAAKGEEAVAEAANLIGRGLYGLGFNLDFAPCADVLTNPENEVIGARSFGSDPALVSAYASLFAKKLRENNVLPTYKHFPGHGGTTEDSHEGMAVLPGTYETLSQGALVPFRNGAAEGIEFIMTGHISCPDITGDYTPASLSEPLTNGILRGDLGYDGIVITDALNMGAVTQKYSAGEAAVLALQAGNDMLLMPEDLGAAHDGVMSALQDGRLSEDRLDTSVKRILEQKYRWMYTEMNALPDDENGEYFYYIDAGKHWHFAYLDNDVPKTDFDISLLTNNEEGISYQDPNVQLIRGIDVSSHNGTIDYAAVKAAGIDFVIIRAAFRGYGEEGTLNTDTKLHENLSTALDAGLEVGVYVFSQAVNEAEAVEEAELVMKELDGIYLSLPIVFDPESIKDSEARTDDIPGEQFTRNSIAFCDTVRAAGYEPMIYCNMVWEAEMLDLSRFGDTKIWYADYENKPQTPYRYAFWQYSEEGNIPGVDDPVDLDVWLKT